jgi:hypothetical protein
MKYLLTVVPFVGLGLLAACSTPAETLTVDCGDRIITLEEGPVTALRSTLAGDNASLAVAACELAGQVPAPAAGTSIPAKVTSQSGTEFTIQVTGK